MKITLLFYRDSISHIEKRNLNLKCFSKKLGETLLRSY